MPRRIGPWREPGSAAAEQSEKPIEPRSPNRGRFGCRCCLGFRLGLAIQQVPGGDLWQIFVDDPNGVMIELNYEAAKEGGSVAPVETREDIGAR